MKAVWFCRLLALLLLLLFFYLTISVQPSQTQPEDTEVGLTFSWMTLSVLVASVLSLVLASRLKRCCLHNSRPADA